MTQGRAIINAKEIRNDGSVIQLVVWRLETAVPPCAHLYKYLYYGANGVCRVRYDNERGKGDHRHLGASETSYIFTTVAQLVADFRRDVEAWEA